MSRKLITIIITLAFVVQSTGASYALRPMASAIFHDRSFAKASSAGEVSPGEELQFPSRILKKLKSSATSDKNKALKEVSRLLEYNKKLATESNLRLVLEMLKDEEWRVCNSALQALLSFIQANKSAFTEANLRLVLEMLKDKDSNVRSCALTTIPLYIQANKAAFTESNLRLVLEMLKAKEWWVHDSALEALLSFIRANKAAFTESNLRLVLEMLKDKSGYARDSALKALPSFIQANKAAFTEANLKFVLEMLKDEDYGVGSSILKALPSFIQANKAAFTEANLRLTLEMLKDIEWWVRKSALEALPSFIRANKAAFTESNLKLVLGMLKDENPEVCSSALETIPSFLQANKALATLSNLILALEMLRLEIHHVAGETFPSFVFAHLPEYSLKLFTRVLWDEKGISTPSLALKAILLFVQANNALATEYNLRLVLWLLKNEEWKARDSALLEEAILSFIKANKAAFTESNIKLLILSHNLGLVNQLMKQCPDLFEGPGWMGDIKRLFSLLDKEAQTRAEDKREAFLKGLYQVIDTYTKSVITKVCYDMLIIQSKEITSFIDNEFDKLMEESKEITSLLDIVHDNLSLCLNSLRNINISLTRFKSLRKVLFFNNPLTRIIRMLGEEKGNLGYLDVTKKIISSGGFNNLYEIILDIAKERQRNAPQEISGLLEVLREVPEKDLRTWGEDGWQSLTSDVGDYYGQGFKVMTYTLFKYFRDHKDDKLLLASLRDDIEKELGNIAWGGFKGLSNKFKKEYNLSTVDELAIIAKFIPIANLSGRDYEGKYQQIKKALQERETWQEEADPALRTLYSFKRTQSTTTYQPQNEKDEKERISLHNTLTIYCSQLQKDLQAHIAKHRIDSPEKTDIKDLKKAILSFMQKRRGIDLGYLSKEPPIDSETERWLSVWHRILRDTWKQDLKKEICNLVENTVKVKGKKRKRIIDETTNFLINIFSEDITKIERQLSLYKRIERETEDIYYVGFFDDLLHLMAFMMTGVCTWTDRDRQIADTKYHFGKIAVKDPSGRLLGSSQVQLARCSIQGVADTSTSKGWRVLALPGINLYEGEIGLSREKAVLAILQAAQKLAKDSGMEGAVIPESSTIHSNHPLEQNLIQRLAEKGYLKKLTLTKTITLSKSPSYSYKEVYLLQIPEKEMFITPASQEDRVADEKERAERLHKEESVAFGEGFGEVVYQRGTDGIVKKVGKQAERMLKLLPEDTKQDLRLRTSFDDIAIRIKIDKDLTSSYINKTEDAKEITLFLGKDILYQPNKIDSVSFDELFSEMLAALILKDYHLLKQESLHDENGYFKLTLIKALLNYKNYLRGYHKTINRYAWTKQNFLDEKTPQEQTSLLDRYRIELNGYTKDYLDISQWNIFLNVMDGADPDFMVYNYLHMLIANQPTTDEDISAIIEKIKNQDITDKPSIAHLREAVKQLLFDGKVRLKILDQIQQREEFTDFDRKQALQELHDTLLTTRNEDAYYQAWRTLLSNTLALSKEELAQELSQLIDKDIFHSAKRQATIRTTLEEILTRRIGKNALFALKEHLTAQRGFKQIPYIKICHLDLNEKDNADDYEFLLYTTQEDEPKDYILMVDEDGTLTEAPIGKDWVHRLFPMKASSSGEIGGADILQTLPEASSVTLREHEVIISISQAA